MTDGWRTSTKVCRWCGSAFVRALGWPWVCPTRACQERCAKWGIANGAGGWSWLPLPLQAEMMEAQAPRQADGSHSTYVLVAGAAGASKSHSVRWGLYAWCLRIPRLRTLLLREVSDELKRSHITGLMEVEAPALGARFVMNPVPMATFSNGSFIEGGHMEDETSVKRYLSSEYDIIVPEEASLYPPEPLAELMTRARTSNEAMRAAGGARCWLPTNPGGPSTQMLRMLFLEREIDADEWPALAVDYRAEEWFHVPGKLEDNPYLDAGYERKLALLKQQWRYDQLRHGDWWAAPGLFFDTFSHSRHVRSIELGDSRRYQWLRGLDWGYHDPGVMLWSVVLTDDHLHIAAELKFSGKTPEDLTPLIRGIDDELRLPEPRREIKTWASPDMWARRGQVGEYLQETARRCGWPVRPAKTERVNGWMRIHSLLRPGPDGEPRLTIDPRCRYLIRTLQTGMSDPADPNDLRQQDDHAAEALRYLCMSRPVPRHDRIDAPRGEFSDDFATPRPVSVGASTAWGA